MSQRKESTPYSSNVRKDVVRVVVDFDSKDVEAIDAWGVPAGMTNRSAAIRSIIKLGLEASNQDASTKEAAEQLA